MVDQPTTKRRRHRAVPPPPDWAHAETIFAQIPAFYQRDRVLFRLLFTCRLKAFEAIRLRREDVVMTDHAIQLTLRDKHGRAGRTIQLSDHWLIHAILMDELRAYIQHTPYLSGPLFRIEGERIRPRPRPRPRTLRPPVTQEEPVDRTEFRRDGQPLTLAIIHERWQCYVQRANSLWTLRELRAG